MEKDMATSSSAKTTGTAGQSSPVLSTVRSVTPLRRSLNLIPQVAQLLRQHSR